MTTIAVVLTLTSLLLSLSVQGQELMFDVLEGAPPSLLGNIALKANLTSVLGQQELSTLQYALVEESRGSEPLFTVDQTTGDFFTRQSLDREGLCGSAASCTVRCDVAVQSSSPESAFFRKFSVVVSVQDANDNSPVFTQQSYLVDISEDEQVQEKFVLPTATDSDVDDRNKIQRYALDPPVDAFDLVVSKQESPTGEQQFTVFLRLLKPLDREVQHLYLTSLVAYDGGVPPRMAVLPLSIDVRDENDHVPMFESAQYKKTLNEETAVGSSVVTVTAIDLDDGDNARVTYSIADTASAEVRSLFAVDENSGTLTVKAPLDMRGGNTYTFEIVAKDTGVPQLSSVCQVVVDVVDTRNDRPVIEVKPLFTHSGAALVPESAAIGKVVALLTVTDRDSGRNGIVSCELNNLHFSLQKLELNEYKIIVARSLDRETVVNHTVSIVCRDGGDPPLTTESVLRVEVSDSNDNMPVFSSTTYFMTVDENEVIGMKVGRVTATDKDYGENARLIYGMENDGDTFTIDTMLGNIYTTQFLDREAKPKYVFNVFAYDSSSTPLTAMATVIVNVGDKNDLRPVFKNDSYTFRLHEGAPKGTFIGQVKATDGDLGLNAQLEYYMVTSRPSPRIPIGVNATGAVVVIGDIDFEKASVYNFVVAAVDMGSPPQNSTVHVTVEIIDRNDFGPVITFPSAEHPSVTISYDTAPGSEIAKVVAHDQDSGPNGQLSYSINVANMSSLFIIDEVTGVISLGQQMLPQDVRAYNIVVSVRDNGLPQRAEQALLRVEVVSWEEITESETNMKIVIALVCVTLTLAIAVLLTLLLIRYFDHRRRRDSEKHKHEILTKSTYQPEDCDKEAGLRTATIFTPKREPGPLFSPKRDQSSILSEGGRSKKKSVSFEKDRQCSERDEPEIIQPVRKASRDSYSMDGGSVSNFSTFKPPVRSHLYSEQPRTGQSSGGPMEGGDSVHAQALRQHNALVRSMRAGGGARPPPYQQAVAEEGDKDIEVWSSTSAETSDSGHGGSELDVSAVKVSV